MNTYLGAHRDRWKEFYLQFYKFAIVGGAATLIDVSVFYICANVLFMHYLLANVFSFIFGLTSSYLFSRNWVFNHQEHNFLRDFSLFTITSLMGLGLSSLILYLLIDREILEHMTAMIISFDDKLLKLTAKFIASCIVLIWNFITKRYIVFKAKT